MLKLMCDCPELQDGHTQEQIQDILKARWDCTSHNVRMAFYTWYRSPRCGNKEHWTDRELWIAFYMYTLHNKIWVDERWISTSIKKLEVKINE